MKTKEIAEFLSAELVGDPDVEISGIASLASAKAGDLSFSEKAIVATTSASAIIVPDDHDEPHEAVLIKTAAPRLGFARAAKLLLPRQGLEGWDTPVSVHPSSDVQARFIGPFVSVGENSQVGEAVEIHAGTRIGSNVLIGQGTIIYPNCVIYDGAVVGNDCVIHAGTIIGSDGFGYARTEEGEHIQFPQIGTVVIEDNVEIGANCTIDRGSLGETRIGQGTKIDNLVQIAHNVCIGKRVLIASQTGIAGSSVIEDDVIIAGQVGIADHVTIRSGAVLGAKSGVFSGKLVRSGFQSGIPARPHAEYLRDLALVRGLERLNETVKKLKK